MRDKILKVLDVRLKQPVVDFFTVNVVINKEGEFEEGPLALMLCQSSLIFYKTSDEGLDESSKVEILFEMIKEVVAATNSYFTLRIDLFDSYFLGLPKIIMAMNNRRDFLNKLKVSYMTYNLLRRLEARMLPVFMDTIDPEILKNLPKGIFYRLKKIRYFNSDKWIQHDYMGYNYLLPKFMVACKQQANIYFLNTGNIYDLDNTNFVSIQFSRDIPLWVKENMDSKNILEYYAYDVMNDWMTFKEKVFTIEDSTIYQKRMMLNNDKSKWMAHYIKARSFEKNIAGDERFYVAVLRRLYIPPLLDRFDDIIVMA